MFRKLIHRIQKRRFCKANRWFCPDCIYHEHLFDGVVYRGVRCHYPTEGGGESDKKTNCSDCGNRNTPVCKYCEHDAEGGIKNGN